MCEWEFDESTFSAKCREHPCSLCAILGATHLDRASVELWQKLFQHLLGIVGIKEPSEMASETEKFELQATVEQTAALGVVFPLYLFVERTPW